MVLTYFGACFVWIIFIPCLFHSFELASVTRFRVPDWIGSPPSTDSLQLPSDPTVSTSPSRYLTTLHFFIANQTPAKHQFPVHCPSSSSVCVLPFPGGTHCVD